MKVILIFALSLPTLLWGQLERKTVFYNEEGERCDSVSAVYISHETLDKSNGSGTVKQTYKNGQVKFEEHYSNLEKRIKDGVCTEYYNNGKLASKINYVNNTIDGEMMTYYSNGQLRRKDIYKQDVFQSGNCYTKDGKDTTHFVYYQQASFFGGNDALMKYLSDNIKYPKKARKAGVVGTVVVSFVVDKKGKVKNINIVKSIHPDLDKAAVKVVKNMPLWTPGISEGENARTRYTLPIKFALN